MALLLILLTAPETNVHTWITITAICCHNQLFIKAFACAVAFGLSPFRNVHFWCFKSSENQSTLLSCACAALAADPSPGFPGNLEFPQFSVLNHPHFLKHRALSMGGRGETQPWLQDWWIPSQQGRADSTESILPINTQLSLKKSGVGSYLL